MKRILTLLLLCAALNLNAQKAFTPGNLVVLRVGDGISVPTATYSPVTLVEYTPAGVLVQTINLGTATPGSQLTVTGNAQEVSLNLSANKAYLSLLGYDVSSGTVTGTGGTAVASATKVVGRVDLDGTVDYTTKILAEGSTVRQITSYDGTRFWIGGNTTGIRSVPFGNSSSTAATTISATAPATNVKAVDIFNNQLYGMGFNGIIPSLYTVGSGLPTTTATNALLAGLPTGATGTNNGFQFFDTDGNGTPDLLYIVDGVNLRKYTYSATPINYISGITVSGGSGYLTAPTVSFSGGGGTGATGVATVNASGLAAVYTTFNGSGYTTAPTVAFSGGTFSTTTATATAVRSGTTLGSITVTNGGAGYLVAPNVSITGGGGSGATATAGITGGVITSITVNNAGSGYTGNPSIAFTRGGTPATATATFPSGAAWAYNGATGIGAVSTTTVTAGGSGYDATSTVTIAAPTTGIQATATLTVSGGAVTAINITNPGCGYTTALTSTSFTFSGPGTGATATAAIFGGYSITGTGKLINTEKPILYITAGSSASNTALVKIADGNAGGAAIAPTYTSMSTAGNGYIFRGIAFAPSYKFTWTGNTNTTWSEGNNWLGGAAPGSLDSAFIPSVASGSGNYPSLPAALSVGLIHIGNSATVTIADNTTITGSLAVNTSATLTIADTKSLTVSGSITGGGSVTGLGKVIMTGADKTIGCSFTNVDLSGSTVNLSGTITVSGILNGITGTISSGTGNTLTLGTSASAVFSPTFSIKIDASSTINFNNSPVTFQSSAAGTFRFGEIAGTLSNATNVTVERYIPSLGRRKYTMVGSPVTSSIYAGWQENGATVTGYGTHITKAGGGVDGSINNGSFDAGVAATGASIFTYNDDNGTGAKWVAITDTKEAATLAPGKGYLLFVRGDRSTNRTTGAVGIGSSSNTVLRATGILGATGSDIVLTSLLKTGANKYSLVANPLTNILDWGTLSAQTATNFVNLLTSFTVYDPNLGVFVTSNGTTVTPSSGSGTSQQQARYIQPGQAFFVQNNGTGTPTLNILESHKSTAGTTTSATTVFGEEQPVANEFAQLNINVFKATDNSFADGAVAIFGNAFNTAVDAKEDIKKFTNFNESFSIRRGNTALGLEARPVLANDTLLFNLGNFGKKDYNFVIDGSNFKNAVATLEDKYTATKQLIDVTGITNYKFTVNSDAASVANDRFMITFGNTLPLVPIADAPASLFVKMSPNPVSGQLMVSFKNAVANETMINVVNSLGQIVKTVNAGNVSTGNVNVPVSELASGIYNVQLISGGKIITTQQVVKAQN